MEANMISWIVKKLSYKKQKKIAIQVLTDLLNSEREAIDNKTAEQLISLIVKSKGNKVTHFIVKD